MELDEFVGDGLNDLLRFAHALTGQRSSAEDVVQDVLMKLFLAPKRPTDISNVGAYARRMVINEYLSWGRKWFRIHPVADVPDHGDGRNLPGGVDDRDELRRELAKLPRRQQAVVVLRFYGDLNDDEIADELGCSVSTVRSHLSRGLAALRIEMTDPVGQEQETRR